MTQEEPRNILVVDYVNFPIFDFLVPPHDRGNEFRMIGARRGFTWQSQALNLFGQLPGNLVLQTSAFPT